VFQEFFFCAGRLQLCQTSGRQIAESFVHVPPKVSKNSAVAAEGVSNIRARKARRKRHYVALPFADNALIAIAALNRTSTFAALVILAGLDYMAREKFWRVAIPGTSFDTKIAVSFFHFVRHCSPPFGFKRAGQFFNVPLRTCEQR